MSSRLWRRCLTRRITLSGAISAAASKWCAASASRPGLGFGLGLGSGLGLGLALGLGLGLGLARRDGSHLAQRAWP